MARLRDATATSAGGIVIALEAGVPRFVAGRRRREYAATWTLPKGTPEPDETTEQTAIREVSEETGLAVRITAPFDSIHYTFIQHGTRIHKTVHYFLMETVGGDLADHDHEFDEVRWIPFADAPGILTFETERNLVARAAVRLGESAAGGVAGPTDPTEAGRTLGSDPR